MTAHFWIATIGVVLYIASMWIAGVMQGLMWRATNPDGTLTYAFVESGQGHLSVLDHPLLGGLMFLSGMLLMAWNTCSRPSPAARPTTRRCWRRPACTTPEEPGERQHETHSRLHRTQRRLDDRPDHPGRQRRRPGRDRAAVLPEIHHPAGGRPQALRRGAAHRARHLYPRGLLQLPFADDPPLPRRDRALRPLLGGRRVRLRPSLPVGLEAHRPGSASRRRPLLRRVASRPPDQSARRGAGIEHAGLCLPRPPGQGRATSRPRCAPAHGRRALQR
jgi:hypothetical protein